MDGLVEIFLFCGVLYYFFNLRANNMVEVFSTRLQEVYAKWETRTDVTRNSEPAASRFSLDGLRRVGQQVTQQRRRVSSREQIRKVRESSLYRIKEAEPLTPAVFRAHSFLHLCCNSCTPSSKNSLVSTTSKQYQIGGKDILIVDPGPSLISKIFRHISHVYSFKKYDYPKVTQTILNDERLKDAIKLTARDTVTSEGCSEDSAMAKAEARAKTILLQMQSNISDFLLRITIWVLYKLLPCILQSTVVQPSQIEMLKKASDTGLPLVMLPLHKSHLDYIMISFLMLSNNIKSPLIAAGDNLKIPFFGKLLSSLGAFFIKRRIDPVLGRKDLLYRAVLHTYVMESLRAGHNIEFFMEGGRSRTGKPCMPKGGILSVIVDAYMDGTIEDALLVPVAMNYERLVDGNFVREQLGQPKKMETFRSTISAIWSTLMGSYGIVKIEICQPFSLREMLKSFQAQQNKLPVTGTVEKTLKYTMSTSSLYGTDVVVEEHRQLVDSIARHVVYDSTKATPIMTTNVVAFLLLNKFRDGCTLDKLVEAFDSIRQELDWLDKVVAFCGESIDIINHALDILGPGLVQQQRQEITETIEGQSVRKEVITAIRPVSILPNVIELSYYSNTMVVHYILDSVVVTGLYAALQSEINDPKAIAENDISVFQDVLLEKTLKVCDILKYEFIFCKPCQDLEQVVLEAIGNLAVTGIITLKEESYLQDEIWSKRYAKNFDDSSDEEHNRKKQSKKLQYKLSLDPEHSSRMEFLHTLLRPWIDTYTYSAFTLRKLVGRSLSERDLVCEVLAEIKTNLDRGIVSYGESLCVDPIKNSFKLFEKWNVLECHPQENVKIYYLKEEYDEDSAANQIYESIAQFKWTRNID
ncbi:glycerol-3-phosphate acyltransferase 1, mitochondrial isoform X2 [Cephus cinctus]|uniref:Glycerol-3-phosphate acyltransferase 1, mitochondrial isoform X2 n=1 Tax=Cephus cinctus TaxID=211228 RepID=A0AAJ7VWW7_CEPCN|nr:glycerol-3-phosphate acyltransferase 1, mitochondrial isoform X2 [Cephus cinctus]XP_015585338.1 glycerol-3-phosphate acyltransferase 1, mitochondrial isoform X2 [Cephus cinctus]XP_015585339.1 glycerol-3-phosphate acyltransferase 1, mitochondrial isoform X2 [Cephus cinctus]XP_024936184.1 glycerol-3-phosphate acyltransferase 1, mitochondrial isoform X2 [Cephus cinctus]